MLRVLPGVYIDLISAFSCKSGAEKAFLEWSLSRFPESLEQQHLEAGANQCSPGCWDSCGLLSVGSALMLSDFGR